MTLFCSQEKCIPPLTSLRKPSCALWCSKALVSGCRNIPVAVFIHDGPLGEVSHSFPPKRVTQCARTSSQLAHWLVWDNGHAGSRIPLLDWVYFGIRAAQSAALCVFKLKREGAPCFNRCVTFNCACRATNQFEFSLKQSYYFSLFLLFKDILSVERVHTTPRSGDVFSIRIRISFIPAPLKRAFKVQ